MFARMGILLAMAVQNILLHRIKSLVVGGILFFGSLFLCTAWNLTRSVEISMADSIQGSLAGDFQVYANDARDKLSLFGGAFFGREELGYIADWRQASDVLLQHPSVEAVVPMGFEGGFVGRGNELDNLFDQLRTYTKLALSGSDDAQRPLNEHIALLQQNLAALRRDLENERELIDADAESQERLDLVSRAMGQDFWQTYLNFVTKGLTDSVEEQLIFLETRIAPLAGEKPPVYLRYMGTDLELFQESFSRFELVKGELPRPDEPWILIPERFYETQLKNLAAVSFDKIVEAMRDRRLTPSESPALASTLRQLPGQVLPLIVAVPAESRQSLGQKLASYLNASPDQPLESLVRSFLEVNEKNALERADWFAQNIAPLARLYDVGVGDMLYLRSYTRTGFLRTVPLRVTGIYRFRGLARSDLAGQTSIIDLTSYRELFGVMSVAAQAELEELTQSVAISGARTATDSQSLEDSLFGASPEASPGGESKTTTQATLTQRPQTKGDLAVNLALILKDRSQAAATQSSLDNWIKDNLPNLQMVDWQSASGLVGQLVTVLRAVLFISVLIIMIVGGAIINNSLMMSTLERTREIGTLRAIGATKSVVTGLFLGEIVLLAALAVYGGALAALGLNIWLNQAGIPAPSDFVVFLFSGPKLYPYVSLSEHFLTASVLFLVAVLSSSFPARLASKILPAVAMQEKE
jgi:ABC-type lipoprotein release transport system permease subunit